MFFFFLAICHARICHTIQTRISNRVPKAVHEAIRKRFLGPLTGVSTTAQCRSSLYHDNDEDDDLLRSGANVNVSYRVSPYRNYRARGRTVVIDRIPRVLNIRSCEANGRSPKPKRVRETVDVSRVCRNGRYARTPRSRRNKHTRI